MHNDRLNRRGFMKAGTGWLGLALTGSAFAGIGQGASKGGGKEIFLSFSTLGCPDWSFSKILEFAVANEYQGIEIRGIQRQLDLWAAMPEINSRANILSSRKRVEGYGLSIVDLGSSCELHHAAGTEREKIWMKESGSSIWPMFSAVRIFASFPTNCQRARIGQRRSILSERGWWIWRHMPKEAV